jgi:hypothetical protein
MAGEILTIRKILPPDRKGIKQRLRFLDDEMYEAWLAAKRYITNSKRPLIKFCIGLHRLPVEKRIGVLHANWAAIE